jgi:putative (di)nucleoside polyphosphate hydrolase
VSANKTAEEVAILPYRPNVGLMVLNNEGRVFTGQRLDYPSSAWQMPQGGIDAGEEEEVAAYRELQEETGILPEMVKILARSRSLISYDFPLDVANSLGGRFKGQQQRWFLMQFSGGDEQVSIQTEVPEFAAWKWMHVNDLLDNIVPFKRAVYEQVLNEFGDYLDT